MILLVNQKLRNVMTTLNAVAPGIVYHYHRPADMKRFIVWQEEAEDNSFTANNRRQEICITGTIDFYTPTEYDQTVDDIAAALSQAPRIRAEISAVQYEDETNLIHYTWTFWAI